MSEKIECTAEFLQWWNENYANSFGIPIMEQAIMEVAWNAWKKAVMYENS